MNRADHHPELIFTGDGSHTLLHPLFGDSYHSTRGAVGESQHVFIRNGISLVDKPVVKVFEMGFGSGLNALLTLKYSQDTKIKVDYHAVELYPVPIETVRQLNYLAEDAPLYPAFIKMHESDWGEAVAVTESFNLKKSKVSLPDMEFDTTFDLIYFDAFSPDTQPELWSEEIFRKLYLHTEPGGVLVTYSSKGSVKRALRGAGYEVKRVEGALGKRHMVVARK